MRRVEIPIHRPSVGSPELEAVGSVLESRWLGMGRVAREFEERIGELVGCRHALAVTSGSAALHLALDACQLDPGDEVILPSMTFVACPQAVLAVGARPVFCEVNPRSVTIDVAGVADRITSRTRVVMPVHYGGFPSPMNEIMSLSRLHGLRVVEDAAHAFGSAYGDRMIGSIGDITCFSFDPVKNITCGDGGALTTDNDDLAARIRRARNLGIDEDSWTRRDAERPWYYEASGPGFRYHLSDVNAAIGLAQLDRFDEIRSRKRSLLRRYRDELAGIEAVELIAGDIDSAFPFLCAIRVLDGRRDALLGHLRENGIHAWVHFVPTHIQPAFASFAKPLPVTERLYGELLTLPLSAELSEADVDRVVDRVREFFDE